MDMVETCPHSQLDAATRSHTTIHPISYCKEVKYLVFLMSDPRKLNRGKWRKRFYGTHLLIGPLARWHGLSINLFDKNLLIRLGRKPSLARTALYSRLWFSNGFSRVVYDFEGRTTSSYLTSLDWPHRRCTKECYTWSKARRRWIQHINTVQYWATTTFSYPEIY